MLSTMLICDECPTVLAQIEGEGARARAWLRDIARKNGHYCGEAGDLCRECYGVKRGTIDGEEITRKISRPERRMDG